MYLPEARHSRIVIIRHGETTSNRDDIVSGGNDNPELTEKGIEQAKSAGKHLIGLVGRTFSSDRVRCIRTGELAFGLPIDPDDIHSIWNERYYGKFDGGPNDDWKKYIEEAGYNTSSLAKKHRFNFLEDIENEHQLLERVLGGLAIIAARSIGKEVGLSTSGGIVRMAAMEGRGIYIPTGKIDNLAEVVLDHDGEVFKIVSSSGVHFPEDNIVSFEDIKRNSLKAA